MMITMMIIDVIVCPMTECGGGGHCETEHLISSLNTSGLKTEEVFINAERILGKDNLAKPVPL